MQSNIVDEKDLYKPQEVKSPKAEKAEQQTESDVKYTMFVSGLNYGGRNIEMKGKNFTNDIAIIFDQVENYSFKHSVDKTGFAVEDKSTLSDHAVIKDGVFSFTGRVNTSPHIIYEQNYIDRNTDSKNPAASMRPSAALEALTEIINKRQLVSLVTEERLLENYIITSLSASKSVGEGAAMVFDVELTEFRTFYLNKVVNATVYSNPKKVGKTQQKGAVNDCKNGSNVGNKRDTGAFADTASTNAAEEWQPYKSMMWTDENGVTQSAADWYYQEYGRPSTIVPSEQGNYDKVNGK